MDFPGPDPHAGPAVRASLRTTGGGVLPVRRSPVSSANPGRRKLLGESGPDSAGSSAAFRARDGRVPDAHRREAGRG